MAYEKVNPIPLTSPYGVPGVRPRINTREEGNKIIKEAIWICPKSGQCFKRGIISEETK